jgi:transposase-like protein
MRLSCPEIAIHKSILMENMKKHAMWSELKRLLNVFKLQLVQEIERGQLTVTEAAKNGIQNRTTVVQWKENLVTLIGKIKHHLVCPPEQKIMELEAKVKPRETEVILNDKFCCR